MQPTAREMQAMAAAGQVSLDDLRAAVSAGGVHDEFLDQMLGGLPQSAWADLSGAAGGKAPDGEGQQQQFGGLYLYDESALLASRLRQHQISGGGGGAEAEEAKQVVMQQLADLRQGQHMMLQAGGGDGGMLLPLSLASGGSGGDVQALLKAAANSTVLIHHRPLLAYSNPLAAFSLLPLRIVYLLRKVGVFIRCSFHYREEKPAEAASPDRPSNSSVSSPTRRFATSTNRTRTQGKRTSERRLCDSLTSKHGVADSCCSKRRL
jgi:hypothetical protein